MKFLSALFNRMRSADAAAAEALKDPIADRKLAIEDAEKAIKGFRQAIAESMAGIKSMEDKLKLKQQDSVKYGILAKSAVKAGNTTDAQLILEKQVKIDKEVSQLQSDIQSENKIVTRNQELLKKETDKIESVKGQTDRLESRHKASETRAKLASLRDSKAFDTLDELENDIKEQEYYAESLDELNTDSVESLEDKYSSTDSEVQDRLNKLMAN